MKKQKIFVGILTVVNSFWFIYTVYTTYSGLRFYDFITEDLAYCVSLFLPTFVGLITFLVAKYIMKFPTFKAFKYANIAAIIPVGVVLWLSISF